MTPIVFKTKRVESPGLRGVAVRTESLGPEKLVDSYEGRLFGPENARLPAPPMLMMDRIVKISDSGGRYDKGEIIAEMDVNPDLWFFKCHFYTDPVMPGCLMLDGCWQLVGFYLGWLGKPGRGRALGSGEVKFQGQVLPKHKTVKYHVHLRKLILRSVTMGVADAEVEVDGQLISQFTDLKVGLFMNPAGES